MMNYWVKRGSEYGQITKVRLSDGCRGGNIPMTVKIWYYRSRYEGYLANIRLDTAGVKMAWY